MDNVINKLPHEILQEAVALRPLSTEELAVVMAMRMASEGKLFSPVFANGNKPKRFSPEARERIAAAQRARWAKIREHKGLVATRMERARFIRAKKSRTSKR